jgi:8-oxo-dGTP diphosphatase
MEPKSIPGVGAFIIHNAKFLLQLRDDKPNIANPNRWGFVGGGIDEGEEPLEAMKRECKEEIDFVPNDVRYQGRTRDEKYRFCIYLSDDEIPRIKRGEGQALKFFSLDEIPLEQGTPRVQLFFTKYRNLAEKLLQGIDIEPEELGLIK